MATPEVDEAPASTAMPIADPTVTSAQPAETALPPPSPVHNTLLADRIDPATAPVTAPIVPTAVPTSTAPATAPPLTPDDSVSPPLVRALTTTALGPATEAEPLSPTATNTTGPTLLVTLLLTTGARHPYKIDHRYLSSRSALPAASAGGEFDPRDLSGYKLKELIWTDWRKEWEDRPESVGSIRLIVMGKLVEDGKSLRGESTIDVKLKECIQWGGETMIADMWMCVRLPVQARLGKCSAHDCQTCGLRYRGRCGRCRQDWKERIDTAERWRREWGRMQMCDTVSAFDWRGGLDTMQARSWSAWDEEAAVALGSGANLHLPGCGSDVVETSTHAYLCTRTRWNSDVLSHEKPVVASGLSAVAEAYSDSIGEMELWRMAYWMQVLHGRAGCTNIHTYVKIGLMQCAEVYYRSLSSCPDKSSCMSDVRVSCFTT